ncbi:hypothetical protein [Campylobacter sp.]|uniref:hypothetical protein n=1 Tax=Campylobacter sp. TaxID=205 RepID=UPI002AA8A017|nr:hypothetical protein [Campylobacter sp.]MCI6661004.1 hypothetical protein [Campylobacter sp.]
MKYFVRILAFLFISFSFGFGYDYTECGVLSEASEFHKKACSVGGVISNVSWNAGDEHFKFSDDYLYEFKANGYVQVEKRYISKRVFINSDDGYVNDSIDKIPCIVCYFQYYNRYPKKKCPVGEYPKLEKSSSDNYVIQICSSNCFELSNRRDRFDCTCNLFGKGNYVSSKIDKTIEISNGGSGGDFYSGEVQCENGSFTDKDISDYFLDSLDDSSSVSKDKLKTATSNFMGANDHHTRNYTRGSSDGSHDGDKGSEKPLSSDEQKQEKDKVEIDEPPAPQNPSESIKYDENTNTVTITDSTGNTQAVTPSNVTKNDKGELESIKYTDPETGKDIEYKTKDDGTWDRVEHQGQGTNPNENDSGTGQGNGKPGGSSDGEGAGTSEDGKKDGKDDGDGKFVGGEFGALGNANDFDKNGELAGLISDINKLEDENLSFLDGLIDNVTSWIDDIKKSINNLDQKVTALKTNPFQSSNITSCPIKFSLLDNSFSIDICEKISILKDLFYTIFYLALNVFIAFSMFKLFVLILVSI